VRQAQNVFSMLSTENACLLGCEDCRNTNDNVIKCRKEGKSNDKKSRMKEMQAEKGITKVTKYV
jgi:hypothetical protein